MKIFERSDTRGWGNRLNVVDENNVVVGYDYDRSCCESFTYFFTKNLLEQLEINEKEINQPDYVFDTSFCDIPSFPLEKYSEVYRIAFKLYNKNDVTDIIYLILENCHNGYYTHGYEMKKDNTIIHEGDL